VFDRRCLRCSFDKAWSSAEKDGSLQTAHPNSHQMQKAYQDVMKYKASSPNFTWQFLLSTGVSAEQAVWDNASMACLVGGPGSLVASNVRALWFWSLPAAFSTS